MRLFQAQTFYGDTTSPPPPPPFSIDREVTRVMPVYLNQYRDGRRLPTPEKVAVMELSNSFERRRLGKHQRILNEISERCRAQEINDLSNKLSNKMNLHKMGRSREMTFYSTTFMGGKSKRKSSPQPLDTGLDLEFYENGENVKPKIYEKNYKQFPARRIMRQHTKFEFLRQNSSLPSLSPQESPTMPLTSQSADVNDVNLRARLARMRQINGSIQLDHYVTPRPDLAPLILPSVDRRYPVMPLSERLDRQDTCFSTSRLTLGPRSKTQLTFDTPRGAHANHNMNSIHDPTNLGSKPPMHIGDYGHELSQLQLTSGHSPPPNSVLGVEVVKAQ